MGPRVRRRNYPRLHSLHNLVMHHAWLLFSLLITYIPSVIAATNPLTVRGLNCLPFQYLSWRDFHHATTINKDLRACRQDPKIMAQVLMNTHQADLLAIRFNISSIAVWREFLSLGFNPAAHGQASIRWASASGHVDLVRTLLQDSRVDPSTHQNHPIQMASKYGHEDVVAILLRDPRVNPATNRNSPVRLAAARGHLAVVTRLLQDSRVDPSTKQNEGLRLAARYGYVEVVKELLSDRRVDPSAQTNDALRQACRWGHSAVVHELLRDPRADPTDNGNEALRLASWNGHIKVVRELLRDPRIRVDYSRFSRWLTIAVARARSWTAWHSLDII